MKNKEMKTDIIWDLHVLTIKMSYVDANDQFSVAGKFLLAEIWL